MDAVDTLAIAVLFGIVGSILGPLLLAESCSKRAAELEAAALVTHQECVESCREAGMDFESWTPQSCTCISVEELPQRSAP